MKKGTILLVALLSLIMAVGCGSGTTQTSIIPAAPAAAAVVAPAAAVSAASVKVPAGGSVTFTAVTAGATAPAAAITADSKVELTAGASYTVAVDPDGVAGNGDEYTFVFTQPSESNGFSALSPTAGAITFISGVQGGAATQMDYTPAPGSTVTAGTTAPTTTTTLTSTQVETVVGDVTSPAFTSTFSHDSDVDADGEYSKGDKFKVTVALNPADTELVVYIKIKADGGAYVEGTRTYNSTAGNITSIVVTSTDIAGGAPHDASNTYMQTWAQYNAAGTQATYTMVNSDGTFPYSGTYTYEIKVTDKAGNMAKATGTQIILP